MARPGRILETQARWKFGDVQQPPDTKTCKRKTKGTEMQRNKKTEKERKGITVSKEEFQLIFRLSRPSQKVLIYAPSLFIHHGSLYTIFLCHNATKLVYAKVSP